STGAWIQQGGAFTAAPVVYDSVVDQAAIDRYLPRAQAFLSSLKVPAACVVLTMVPNAKTTSGTASALARALGRDLVAPEPDGLATYDGSHLDLQSADRWSTAFFAAAGPRISSCLAGSPPVTAAPVGTP